MTTPPEPAGPLEAAQGLTDALQGMERRLGQALRRETVTRRIVGGVTVSLVIDIIVTALATFALVRVDQALIQVRHAQATVAQLHAAEVSSCQQGNQTRAQQVALWEHLYALGVTPQTPPAQRAADNALIAYIRGVFAARDCAAVYRIRPSATPATPARSSDDARPAT